MTVYSNYNLYNDLNRIHQNFKREDGLRMLRDLDSKIGLNYTKWDFGKDLLEFGRALYSRDQKRIKGAYNKMAQKLRIVHFQRSLKYLSEQYLLKNISYRGFAVVRWNFENCEESHHTTSPSIADLHRREFEKDVDKILSRADELRGYPLRKAAGVGAFLGFMSGGFPTALIASAATAGLFSFYQNLQCLGGSPPPPPRSPSSSPPPEGLRNRTRRC